MMDDALLCLYQNGEAVRPSNGYPVRLLLPGCEGNMNVKWLRRLKLTSGPAMTKDETSKYTILLKDEKAGQFVFPMEVKSVITRRAPGITLKGPGFYEISGLAWSGNGSIRQVEVSADGGQSWALAALQGPILPKAPVRFRAPWQWNGGPAVLQSRATDDTGMVQPTRAAFAAERGLRGVYHYNAIASWRIDEKGEATNVSAGAGQIGGCEIVFGSRVGSEGRTLYTCGHASFDADDARPLEKQIPRERGVFERDERVEIPDRGGYRLDPGVVDVRFKQMAEHLSARERRPSMARRKKRRIGAFSKRLTFAP